MHDEDLFTAMTCQFYLKVKQQNGNSSKSLLQILSNLQNYSHTQDSNSFAFMTQKDTRFTKIHTVLDNISQELHQDGVGSSKAQAHVVTDTKEQQLWERGVMGTHSPEALQNVIFYYCELYFCLRGGDKHN